MSLADREYMRQHRNDPPPPQDRPSKMKLWILLVALFLVGIFLLSYWPH